MAKLAEVHCPCLVPETIELLHKFKKLSVHYIIMSLIWWHREALYSIIQRITLRCLWSIIVSSSLFLLDAYACGSLAQKVESRLGEQGIESIHAHFNSLKGVCQRKWHVSDSSWRSTYSRQYSCNKKKKENRHTCKLTLFYNLKKRGAVSWIHCVLILLSKATDLLLYKIASKHLMMYGEAKHPRFRYFALNTEMRWRALQTGRIYIKQHPDDARLSLDELVGREGELFSNRVLHYASGLRGTSQYWFKQRSRHGGHPGNANGFLHPQCCRWSVAWTCPSYDADSSSRRSRAVSENPAISDWFFYHRISKPSTLSKGLLV